MISQVSFKVEVDQITSGSNLLAQVHFDGVVVDLYVEGCSDTTQILSVPINNSVVISRTTAKATKAIKTGNTAVASRLLTKLDTIGNTVASAGDTSTILKTIVGETNKGTIHETIGSIAVDTTGKTVTREN